MPKKTGRRRSKPTSEVRRSRREDSRELTGNRLLSDEARLEEFRKRLYQAVLPDLPKIKRYHVCWLTTTNTADSIVRRVQLGYEPVRASDIPGYEAYSLKTGEYAGCIGVNEMVAYKLPLSLYQMYMAESHHIQPLQEEEKLKAIVEKAREQAAAIAASGSKGIKVYEEEEGNMALGQDPGVPDFARSVGER